MKGNHEAQFHSIPYEFIPFPSHFGWNSLFHSRSFLILMSGVIVMQTSHPHCQSISNSILHDVLDYLRIFATETANAEANAMLPIIMSRSEWNEAWDSAWNSAISYCTEGLTTRQLYPLQESK